MNWSSGHKNADCRSGVALFFFFLYARLHLPVNYKNVNFILTDGEQDGTF